MDLLTYVEKGGVIVYILIALNMVGYTIIIWKFLTLPKKNSLTKKIITKLNFSHNINAQIEYEIKKLEVGLNFIKNIASIAPLLGLLGTVVGVLNAFEAITANGLGNPSIFSSGISIALITTIAGLIVAIPHHICYNYFIAILDELELKVKKEAVEVQ
ncbi:MAG: MotA/TolQ/ExbB proton channel family protein [Candidatus Marinarcus sp.]|uniref:MotA/TolQ/ExbB proton channel family protein n=1 Tax=Candidatus Marinarcus sp. TaxID=3100987 RepID=UPI003AFFE264